MFRACLTYWGKYFLNLILGQSHQTTVWFTYSCLPDSVCVVSERLILPLPEDLRIGNPRHTALQSHRMTICNARVLQFLDE